MEGYTLTDRVTNAAREYNDDVRWGRFDQAASHVAKAKRQRFVERRSALEEELQIADYEVTGIEVDKKKNTATARVQYSWTLRSRQLVEKTTTKQEWEQEGREWIMAKETRLSGSPLVIFDEQKKAQLDEPTPEIAKP
jgi:hypothetical protein